MTRQRGGSTRDVGADAERRAAEVLHAAGLEVVDRNFTCRFGEIDLVCRDGDELVFVEVRSRADASHGTAAETVTRPKQRQVARVARAYLHLRRPAFDSCRFDVVAVTGDHVEHIRDAFRADDWL